MSALRIRRSRRRSSLSSAKSPGHVFVVRSDLTQVSCDAWLVPTDRRLTLAPYWFKGRPLPALPTPSADWGHEGLRTLVWPGWPADEPQPWLTNVGRRAATADWYVEGARQFLVEASQAVKQLSPWRGKRSRPLLALPLVGTGMGGAWLRKGGVVSALLPMLVEQASQLEVDVALITFQAPSLAACQRARPKQDWAPLTPEQLQAADRLAVQARQGEVALFLGSGVSRGAGLPTWAELLSLLAEAAGYSEPFREALERMDLLDQAQILQRSSNFDLRSEVSRLLDARFFSLAHALLAGIPHQEAVTQNYDCLFETALTALGEEPSILPYRPQPNRRWLLKMHGCIKHHKDIVLSREDFHRYLGDRGALSGLVQGLLLTRHLLFVGFSLTDHNFLSIVDVVRRARHSDGKPFGTALLLKAPDPLFALWEKDLELISFDDPRELEMFLDRVQLQSCPIAQHLLDPTFASLLSDKEMKLRKLLESLLDEGADLTDLPAWGEVEQMLRKLGG